jgi:F-type H+-transporting ATPase subunit gamma
MQTIEAIKRQLETAGDLRSIVRTMKALAAVSIRQYEEALASLAEYARSVELGMQALVRHRPAAIASMPAEPARRPGVIVLGSDQGLCGAFNEHIAAFYVESRASTAGATSHGPVLAVGLRVAGRLEDAGVPLATVLMLPVSAALVAGLVEDLLGHVDAWRAAGEVDGVWLYYNRPVQGAAYRPHQEALLPLDVTALRAMAAAPWRPRAAPSFASDWDVLFSAVVRQRLFVTLHHAVAASLAAENASRLAAMHAAQRNIEERLETLHGQYHLQRQTSITTELLDIVSGYETLTSRSQGRAR